MRFDLVHTGTGQLLVQLEPATWTIDDPVQGRDGNVELVLPIPDAPMARDRLKALLDPDFAGIYVTGDDGSHLGSGPMVSEPEHTFGGGQLTLKFADWRSWFYTAVLRPTLDDELHTGDYIATSVEQLTAMTDLAARALDDPAAPPILVDEPDLDGIVRDEVVERAPAYVGEALDRLASRERGAQWWTVTQPDATDARFVVTRFLCGTRFSRTTPVRAEWTPEGGNIIAPPTWPATAARVNRVFALGAGSPPDQGYAMDQDPALDEDPRPLLREYVSGPHADVNTVDSAYEHAVAQRDARSVPVGSVEVDIFAHDPPVHTYVPGDICDLVLVGDWKQVHHTGARITRRIITGHGAHAVTARLTLDLTTDDDVLEEGS